MLELSDKLNSNQSDAQSVLKQFLYDFDTWVKKKSEFDAQNLQSSGNNTLLEELQDIGENITGYMDIL